MQFEITVHFGPRLGRLDDYERQELISDQFLPSQDILEVDYLAVDRNRVIVYPLDEVDENVQQAFSDQFTAWCSK